MVMDEFKKKQQNTARKKSSTDNDQTGRTLSWIPGPDQPDEEVHFTEHRIVSGVAIGIICTGLWRPVFPGNVCNASSYTFPVIYQIIEEKILPEQTIVGDPALIPILIRHGEALIRQGVRAVVSSIGYFGNYQKEMANALNRPVFMSSLLQIPMILQSIKPNQKIAVIAAWDDTLTDKLLDQCGVSDKSRVISIGIDRAAEYQRVSNQPGCLNSRSLERDMVKIVSNFIQLNPDVGAILLECGEMPTYSWAIQNALGLPVYDYITMIKWIESAVVQRPISGFI
jgi:hypothetical protein